MIYKKCGYQLPDGTEVCDRCGFKQSEYINNNSTTTAKGQAIEMLLEFINYLQKDIKIREEYSKEADSDMPKGFISDIAKSIIKIFIGGTIGSIIIIMVAEYGGYKAVSSDVAMITFIIWGISGLVTWKRKTNEYNEYKYALKKQIEDIKQYEHEKLILDTINKDYNDYIGGYPFSSALIRGFLRKVFQTEIQKIITFAEDNHMGNAELSEITELFYENRHDVNVRKIQEDVPNIKEKLIELKVKSEDVGAEKEIIEGIEKMLTMIDDTLLLDPKNLTMSVKEFSELINKISTYITDTTAVIQEAEEQRKAAIESFVTNIPNYQNEIIEISLIREKYPDNELSSSFIRDYERKMSEIKEKIDLPLESIEKRAFEIDSEIKSYIASLKDMIKEEYAARHKKIYGKVDNKLAHKFLKNYK